MTPGDGTGERMSDAAGTWHDSGDVDRGERLRISTPLMNELYWAGQEQNRFARDDWNSPGMKHLDDLGLSGSSHASQRNSRADQDRRHPPAELGRDLTASGSAQKVR